MQNKEESHRFDHIIHLPHHVSRTRQPMSSWSRAAQFSPFAALTGYEDAVEETARLTTERIELDEEARLQLDQRLQRIQTMLQEEPEVTFTYFVPDERKTGGEYVTCRGRVKRMDLYQKRIRLNDGTEIPMEEITAVEWEADGFCDS